MLSILNKSATLRKFVNLTEINRFKSIAASFVNTSGDIEKSPPNFCGPLSTDLTLELREEAAQFMLVFPDVVRSLTEFHSRGDGLREAANHFSKALEYNVPHGKQVRGLTSVIVYKDLIGKDQHTPENIRQAHLLGWCVELLQSAFLIADDMIDCSEIRRNQPCWYKVKDVQSIAVNDAQMIENACFFILKRFFGHLPCYLNMHHLLHESAMTTFIGQSLDFHMSKADVMTFSMEKYRCINDYKTSHFAFYAPIGLAMTLAGYGDAKLVKDICFEMGHYYQVQNDFFDCFGDSGVLKKPGTDIEDGKCSWLSAMAMKHGSDKQKAILKQNYGKNDQTCINKVRQVYIDLDLPEMYSCYEEKTYNDIKLQIEQVPWSNDLLQRVLTKTLNRTFIRAQGENNSKAIE